MTYREITRRGPLVTGNASRVLMGGRKATSQLDEIVRVTQNPRLRPLMLSKQRKPIKVNYSTQEEPRRFRKRSKPKKQPEPPKPAQSKLEKGSRVIEHDPAAHHASFG